MRSRGLPAAAVTAVLISALTACGGGAGDDHSSAKVPITTTSDEARAAYLHGRDLYEALRFTDAHQYFVSATELDPNFALAWMAAANTSPSAQEFFAALRHATANAAGASDGEQMMIGALEAGVNADPGTQLSLLQSLVAAYPGDERAHNALGIFLLGQQKYEAAAAEYRKAIVINPEFPQPYNQLGYALRFTGEYDAAEQAFKRYIELIPDQPNPYDSYAELLMKMGRYEESIQSYEKALAVEPTFIASYIGIAHDLLFMDRPEDARAALLRIEGVARTGGELRQMHTWMAAAYLHQGDFEGALGEVQRRYDLAAETDDRPAMSGDLNLMGTILLWAGSPGQAAVKYGESVAMMESSDATDDIKEGVRRNHLFDTARVALRQGDIAAAADLAAAYGEAVAEHNVRFELQQSHQLEGMLDLAADEPKAALFELANANQQNPEVLLLNALAFAAAGDHDAALAACRQVVDFNQLSFNLAFVRGEARAMLETL
jgi:tetratricopeptide (TPR) repeat protein